MRYSKQRESIYDFLYNSKEHPSAEIIYASLKEDIPALSLGTVYRNLKFLEEQGRIQRVASVKNMERYDARVDEHAHFLCDSCGSVIDLDELNLNTLKDSLNLSKDMAISKFSLSINGICKNCQEKN